MNKEYIKSQITEKKVRGYILKELEKNKDGKFRKELINNYISENIKFTQEELKDKKPESILTVTKSILGTFISKLIGNEDIVLNEDRKLILNKDIKEIAKEIKIEDIIFNKLSEKKDGLTRKEILSTFSLKERSLVGQKIKELSEKNKIYKNKNNKYQNNLDDEYLNTEIGELLRKVLNKKSNDIKKEFIQAINLLGGEAFEPFSVTILKKCFSENYEVISEKVTGGINDEGIDGVIKIKDKYFDYEEEICIQTKQRKKQEIPVKDMREFLGSMIYKKYNKGIFVTNSKFHREAIKFIKKEPRIIGVDGNKLYELAKKTKYGIIEKDGYLILDKEVFIIKIK